MKKTIAKKRRVQIKLNNFNPDKREVEAIYTALMDAKNHLDRKEQDFFLDEECGIAFTNRQLLAIVGELFVLRVSVDALQEKVFPGAKESAYAPSE